MRIQRPIEHWFPTKSNTDSGANRTARRLIRPASPPLGRQASRVRAEHHLKTGFLLGFENLVAGFGLGLPCHGRSFLGLPPEE
jgi:hypothetical protein